MSLPEALPGRLADSGAGFPVRRALSVPPTPFPSKRFSVQVSDSLGVRPSLLRARQEEVCVLVSVSRSSRASRQSGVRDCAPMERAEQSCEQRAVRLVFLCHCWVCRLLDSLKDAQRETRKKFSSLNRQNATVRTARTGSKMDLQLSRFYYENTIR